MSDYLVCAGPKVLLPGNDDPTPASIIVDKSSGKILEVRQGQHTTQDLGLTGCSVEWIDAGNNVVLPGLVESVYIYPYPPVPVSKKHLTAPMFISMNQDAQRGRDFGREQELLLQGVLQH